MAREKKKEILTPEERLQAALVPESEQPYKVPGNWCWTYLTKGAAECLDSFRKPINASERANREGDIPYYGATGQVGWIDDFLTNEQLVLVGEDGAPFLDLIKDKAYIIEGKAWVNNHAHILRSRFGTVGNLFLMHYLNVFNYNDFVNGTTRLKLTQGSMDTIPVPIPPVPEQQRIVDRIESLFAKLDEAKQKAQDALDSFETRKAAILHKAFTGELTAQWRKEHGVGMESWEKKALGDITDILSSKRIYKEEYTANGIPFFRSSEVVDLYDTGNTKPTFFISEQRYEEIKNQYGVPDVGDLLVTSVGTIGKTWIVDNRKFYYKDGNLTQVKKSKLLDMRFLQFYIMSPEFKKQIDETVSGSAYNALTIVKFKKIRLPIPSVIEQSRIVRILDDLLAKEQQAKEAAEGVLEQIDLMKKAILARAFRGELGTNAPREESAVELVKRVLAVEPPPKTRAKAVSIPREVEEQLKSALERKIIKLYYPDSQSLPINTLMEVSSKKFEVLESIRNLEQRNIIKKLPNGNYKLVR